MESLPLRIVSHVVIYVDVEDFHRRSERQFLQRAGSSMLFCRAMLQPTMGSFGSKKRLRML